MLACSDANICDYAGVCGSKHSYLDEVNSVPNLHSFSYVTRSQKLVLIGLSFFFKEDDIPCLG